MSMLFGDRKNPIDDLRSIFYKTEDPVEAAMDWGREVLETRDINPTKNPMKAIKELREKEPALGLKSATYLVKKLS